MEWDLLHPNAMNYLGLIPFMLDEGDEDPAIVQFDKNYAHGGGWRPFKGHTLNPETLAIQYPGDPEHLPVAKVKLREETIVVYPHAWVMVLQPDSKFEIARLD